MSTTIKICKHVVGLALIAAILVGVVVAGFSINSATKAKSAAQVAMNRVTDDGTTHDMTIVWPTGQEQNVSYSETITPRSSTYTGPKNVHQTEIFMLSLNPLDSVNKAGQGITPSTFAEGDRPALVLNEGGVNATKTKGAETVGQGGADPAWGEYLGWFGMILVLLIGLAVIAALVKWLYPGLTSMFPGSK